jgi:hypothetical protein
MKLLLATFLALVACLCVSARPALAEPVTVKVAIWINDILKYDPNTGFTVDAYLQFDCDRPCGEITYTIYNGRASSREVLVNEPDFQVTRMEMVLTEAADLRTYPFDTHQMAVRILCICHRDEIRFVADTAEAGLGDVKLQGWLVDPNWHDEADAYFDKLVSESALPDYEFRTNMTRPVLAGFFKTILPALAILVVGSFGLIIGPEERIKRFDLFNAAFLGTVLFQLNVLSSLPPLAYLTYADRFLLINLMSIILGVGSSVWIILDYRAGNKARAWKVHGWLLAVVPLVWLSLQSLNLLTMYVWDGTDWRVWAIAAVELVIILAFVPWRRRSLQMARQFRSGYRNSLRQTRQPKKALEQELDIVASQRPFDTLSKEDLDTLIELFAPLPDPTILADVLEEARRTGDVSILKDRAALERFTQYVASQHSSEKGDKSALASSAAVL